jgi:hypothetical protein
MADNYDDLDERFLASLPGFVAAWRMGLLEERHVKALRGFVSMEPTPAFIALVPRVVEQRKRLYELLTPGEIQLLGGNPDARPGQVESGSRW